MKNREADMRSKDPELMNRIYEYVDEYVMRHGTSPSTAAIGGALGISKATAYRYLLEMNDKGMLSYDGTAITTEKTVKMNSEVIMTPLVGSVPCGTPQYEEENIDEYIALPTAIFGNGDYFALRASGNSMTGAGIDDGDLVVVRKQKDAADGDIVVALVNSQSTLKRFFRDEETGRVILHPENSAMEDIIPDECYIQGVACHIIKTLQR